jgi:crossover junction endodeoxyribonuclease RusA
MKPVCLAWPVPALRPNGGRGHWAAHHRATKKAKAEAFWLARAAGWKPGTVPAEGPIGLRFQFFATCRRNRDDDNLVASMKAARDGLAEALGIDDARFRCIVEVVYPLDRPKRGFVMATIEAAP